MMEQEVVEIEILYFYKSEFYQYLDDQKRGIKGLSPADQSWDYFFRPKKEKHEVLEILEYENGIKFILLNYDILLWYEPIPSFKDGKFSWISEDSRLISLRSLREKSKIYNNLFNIDQSWSNEIKEMYKILDRNDKLKKLNI